MRRRDGTTFPAETQSSMILDLAGRARGVRTLVRDITARKELEARLEETSVAIRSPAASTAATSTQARRARGAVRALGLPAVRPDRLQEHQRHLRPRRGRPRAAGIRPLPVAAPPQRGHPGAARRRRVRALHPCPERRRGAGDLEARRGDGGTGQPRRLQPRNGLQAARASACPACCPAPTEVLYASKGLSLRPSDAAERRAQRAGREPEGGSAVTSEPERVFEMRPIGFVRSPYQDRVAGPERPRRRAPRGGHARAAAGARAGPPGHRGLLAPLRAVGLRPRRGVRPRRARAARRGGPARRLRLALAAPPQPDRPDRRGAAGPRRPAPARARARHARRHADPRHQALPVERRRPRRCAVAGWPRPRSAAGRRRTCDRT